ncbi:MAG: glycosyltransferase family 2 protein [Candidatus Omnitrophica bacterium]|nr:glycosyltransferase family 2 protein [Candidatus Omnitrophota bacterium]
MIKKLSIIIPVFNEKDTVAQVIQDIYDIPLQNNIEKELIVVDDGSSDGTRDVLAKLDNRNNTRIFYHSKNQGKTFSVKFGFKQMTGDVVVIQDADLEYSPKNYPRLLDPILNEEAEVVYGSRFLGSIKNMTAVNRTANIISNWTINRLYGSSITDLHTCLKVFKKEVLNGISINSQRFSFDTEITAKLLAKGVRIREIPIAYEARLRLQGKKITWLTALESYKILWRIYFKKDF